MAVSRECRAVNAAAGRSGVRSVHAAVLSLTLYGCVFYASAAASAANFASSFAVRTAGGALHIYDTGGGSD